MSENDNEGGEVIELDTVSRLRFAQGYPVLGWVCPTCETKNGTADEASLVTVLRGGRTDRKCVRCGQLTRVCRALPSTERNRRRRGRQ